MRGGCRSQILPGPMPTATPLHFLLLTFAGWVNRQQNDIVGYLLEENRVLREQLERELGGRRVRRKPSWKAFLKAHWEAVAAMDFFTVEVVTIRGSVRNSVPFAIGLSVAGRGTPPARRCRERCPREQSRPREPGSRPPVARAGDPWSGERANPSHLRGQGPATRRAL